MVESAMESLKAFSKAGVAHSGKFNSESNLKFLLPLSNVVFVVVVNVFVVVVVDVVVVVVVVDVVSVGVSFDVTTTSPFGKS